MSERIKVSYRQAGKGHLELFDVYRGDEHVGQFFSFRSLPEVLGMPLGTLEGRYSRGRLHTAKRDIATGQSRPIRAFPMERFDEIVAVIRTPGARMVSELERVEREHVARGPSGLPLEVRTVGRNKYITLRAVADHYGKSLTTIRTRLDVAGLLKKAQDVYLNPSAHGGRATKCFPAELGEQIKRAIEEKATFHDEIDTALAMAGRRPTVEPERLHPMQEKYLRGEGVTQRLDQQQVRGGLVAEEVDSLVAEIQGMLAKSKPVPPLYRPLSEVSATQQHQAPDPFTTQTYEPWITQLRGAQDIWVRDAVIDRMTKAGLSTAQIGEAIALAESAAQDQERSAGA
jgi:hypothetical protein